MVDETSHAAAGDTDAILDREEEAELDDETRYVAVAAGDCEAIVDWDKLADLELNDMYGALQHTIIMHSSQHSNYIRKKLANTKLLFKLNGDEETALHLAAKNGHFEVTVLLTEAARLLESASAYDMHPSHPISSLYDFIWHPNRHKATALHLALRNGQPYIFLHQLLKGSHPRYGLDIKNYLGETPFYLAVKLGDGEIVKEMRDCSYVDGLLLDGPDDCATAMHIAIMNLHRGQEYIDIYRNVLGAHTRDSENPYSGYEAIFDKTDKNYDTVLSLLVRENQLTMVEEMLTIDPGYRNGRVRKKNALRSVISIAKEKGYTNLHNLLTRKFEARKDIGHADQTSLHAAITKGDEEYMSRLLRDDKDLVSMVDFEEWTPLHYAAYYDFESILDATHVGYKAEEYESANEEWWVPTPLHVAAGEGHTFTLIKLMELLPASLYVAADSLTGQNILHLAVLASEIDMILHILKKCPEEYIDKILNQQDVNGDTPLHLLIRDGCFVPQLIKHQKINRTLINKQHWTSFDMLYFKDQIVADQVKIKKALDDFEAQDLHRNFWQRLMLCFKSIDKKSKLPKSLLAPGKLRRKDNKFLTGKKLLIKENLIEMKDKLDRYRQRTNTQIIVTALITTVTFTVGFTMPGGLHQDGELEGMVILSNKKAFIAFMVTDALALLLSMSSLFLYFIASMYEDPHSVSRLNDASTVLNIVSVISMTLTFITGTYLVLSHSRAFRWS